MSSTELRLFGEIISRLERMDHASDAREAIFGDVVRLIRADYAASFVFNKSAKKFERGITHNMDPENISRYEKWFQFRDPHTFELRARRRATLVEEVTPYRVLERTEFYNDFLKRDGLHHGVNLFLFDGTRDIGDFRLWRSKTSPDFSDRDTMLLNTLSPYLQRSFQRIGQHTDDLTSRERQVADLVAKGCRDRDIGKMLGISFSTVRTHLNRAMEKKGCANRAELAASIAVGNSR